MYRAENRVNDSRLSTGLTTKYRTVDRQRTVLNTVSRTQEKSTRLRTESMTQII